jgi:hypothetical protein
VIRRFVESAAKTLPLGALLVLPVLFGSRWVYHWTQRDDLPASQAQYFDPQFFVARTALYFLVWMTLTFLLEKWSRDAAEGGDARRLRLLSGPGLLAWGFAATFAAIDWVMSLEPMWYSTVTGLMFIAGLLLSALSFAIVGVALTGKYLTQGNAVVPDNLHNLGRLLLTFVMLWAYLAFSQLLIIWSENLPEEIQYYVRRLTGGWLWLGMILVLFHFAVPFFLLLSSNLKRSAGSLAALAGLIVLMRGVDLFWHTGPALSPGVFHIHWMDFAVPAGIGGIWISYFFWHLRRHPEGWPLAKHV